MIPLRLAGWTSLSIKHEARNGEALDRKDSAICPQGKLTERGTHLTPGDSGPRVFVCVCMMETTPALWEGPEMRVTIIKRVHC